MYIDINTLFTFEVSKNDDQSILAAIVLVWLPNEVRRTNRPLDQFLFSSLTREFHEYIG
jgi:hypothetical protein